MEKFDWSTCDIQLGGHVCQTLTSSLHGSNLLGNPLNQRGHSSDSVFYRRAKEVGAGEWLRAREVSKGGGIISQRGIV